ncbi:hypothetical protein Taro_025705, partial [Colocasia esculenta]|nr:hypothetical protein [Colocasia esculenta]
ADERRRRRRQEYRERGKMVAFTAIKLLAWLVLAGWVLMWAMRPTYTYKKVWQPKLQSETNSTYFGPQGTNILIYTFPIVFISVLGCVYLHFKDKRATQSSVDKSGLAFWRRPALWKGPLGIVSWTQLCFFLMFVALLVWSFAVYLKINFTEIDNGTSMYANMSRGTSGYVGAFCCAFLFFPVTRGSSVLPLFGLSPEASIKYHVWLGHITLLLFALHSFGFVIYWAITDQAWQLLKWQKVYVPNLAGEISMVFGLILWATTFRPVRRNKFELFFYTHQLYALFMFFFLLHVGISYFCIILSGVYLFMLDRYLRFLQSQSKVRLVSARHLPNETVELNFSKNPRLNYGMMSSAFIKVPSISKLQWHPFTVTSNNNMEPDTFSVVVVKQGTWTQKLSQTLSSPSLERLEVALEGPYGHISCTDFLRYESLVMVSGGSGITPFISIIRELLFRSAMKEGPGTPTSVRLICAFKTTADLTMLDLLLPLSSARNEVDLSRLNLIIEAFVTRDTDPNAGNLKKSGIQTLWLKPLPTDVPVTAVLGENSWLCLGAIISASFVSFLLLLGILNRYYIYPIDKNTDEYYSDTAKAVLQLLFICVCIAGFASVAFYWVRRGLTTAAKRVQITDLATTTSSPASWFYGADRELESHPHQAFFQAAKVQYGARPELKKMLLELDDVETGVLVSGPSGMRREVAKICSSGLAQNLHFESVSFTW